MKNKRVEALKEALDDEVHGLWISDEMAIKILAKVDAVTESDRPKAIANPPEQ